MGERNAQIFETLRADVLGRLVEVRGSISESYTRVSDNVVRDQFDVVLGKMQSYLVNEDDKLYRGFARRWLAMRGGEGFTQESLIHAVAAIGDVVQQVAHQRLGATPECAAFCRDVARMSYVAATMLVDVLAEQVERRERRYRALAAQGNP
jgi:hypothetical protein